MWPMSNERDDGHQPEQQHRASLFEQEVLLEVQPKFPKLKISTLNQTESKIHFGSRMKDVAQARGEKELQKQMERIEKRDIEKSKKQTVIEVFVDGDDRIEMNLALDKIEQLAKKHRGIIDTILSESIQRSSIRAEMTEENPDITNFPTLECTMYYVFKNEASGQLNTLEPF